MPYFADGSADLGDCLVTYWPTRPNFTQDGSDDMRQHEQPLAAKLTAGLGCGQMAYGQFLTELRSALRTHLQKRAGHIHSEARESDSPYSRWPGALAGQKMVGGLPPAISALTRYAR